MQLNCRINDEEQRPKPFEQKTFAKVTSRPMKHVINSVVQSLWHILFLKLDNFEIAFHFAQQL